MEVPEIKILINGDDLITPEVSFNRNGLALSAYNIKSVTTAGQNQISGECVVKMRKHVKDVTADRMKRTKILDDAKKLIMDFYGEHCEILETEIKRLTNLGTNFIESENKRVAEEEAERQRKFKEAQEAQFNATTPVQEMIARRKVQNIIATPEPEVQKAKGQSVKQALRYEVTDILELVRHNPQLCKIEVKASAINATCHPNLPVPGLKLWFENVATYTTR